MSIAAYLPTSCSCVCPGMIAIDETIGREHTRLSCPEYGFTVNQHCICVNEAGRLQRLAWLDGACIRVVGHLLVVHGLLLHDEGS